MSRINKPILMKARFRPAPSNNKNQYDNLHVWLVATGAVLSGIAAVLSVLIATGFSWVTQQAEQERYQYELGEQAYKVSMWTVGGETHVLNRSPDPIVTWDLILKSTGSTTGQYLLTMETIPPCTELNLNLTLMRHRTNAIPLQTPPNTFSATGIYFLDRYGEDWFRSSNGELFETRPEANYSNTVSDEEIIVNSSPASSCDAP